MDQVSIKSTNIFQWKFLQYLPKFGFFYFENKPSGNPGVEQFLANDVTSSLSDEIITLIT
jgi:hypothetical protein